MMLSNHQRIYSNSQTVDQDSSPQGTNKTSSLSNKKSAAHQALTDYNNSPILSQFTTSTRLLSKRKELLDVQSALNTKRHEFSERLALIKEKEKGLGDERDRLTGYIMELDKFIRENEMRKERAEEKERLEIKTTMQMSSQINDLLTKISKLEQQMEQKRFRLEKRYKRYHQYLQDVVAHARGQENLDEVDSLMKRHNSLSEHNIELQTNAHILNDRRLQQEHELKRYKIAKEAEIINANMNIAKLNRLLEEQIARTSQAQKEMEEGQSKSSYGKVVTGQVEMACKNLYRRVTTFTKLQSKTREAEEDGDIDKMMERIRIKVVDFGIIKDRVEEKLQEAALGR